MSAALVQSVATVDNDSSTSKAHVFGSNVTAGNQIAVAFYHSYPGCAPTVTDSRGNTYTNRVSASVVEDTNRYLWVFTAPVGSSGACTVTIAFACGNISNCFVGEVSGLHVTAPYTTHATKNNTTNPVDSGAVTTVETDSLIVCLFFCDPGGPSYTPGTGYTELIENGGRQVQYKIESTTGSVTPQATVSNNEADTYGTSVVFGAATVASGTPRTQRNRVITPTGKPHWRNRESVRKFYGGAAFVSALTVPRIKRTCLTPIKNQVGQPRRIKKNVRKRVRPARLRGVVQVATKRRNARQVVLKREIGAKIALPSGTLTYFAARLRGVATPSPEVPVGDAQLVYYYTRMRRR